MLEAFKIGITIAITNAVSPTLAAMSKDFFAANKAAIALRDTMKSIGYMKLGAIGLAGYGTTKLLEATLKSANEYNMAFARFKEMNLGDAMNSQADKFARGTTTIGASATDLMTTIRNLTQVLGSAKDAMALAPWVSQMEFANESLGGGPGSRKFDSQEIRRLAQIVEIRGGFKSKEALQEQANMMQQVMAASGFMIMPSDYFAMMQTGGVAAQRLKNKAFYYEAEPIIQEIGGSRFGTGLMTSYNRLVLGMGAGSPGGKAYIQTLEDLGLVDRSKIEQNGLTGRITKVMPGFLGAQNTQAMVDDPFQFLMNVLVPAMRAHGYDDNKIMEGISQIYGRTGGALFSKYFLQWAKVQKNVGISENAMGVAASVQNALNSPTGAEEALGKAWDSFKTSIGIFLKLRDTAIFIMNTLTGILNVATKVINTVEDFKEKYTHHGNSLQDSMTFWHDKFFPSSAAKTVAAPPSTGPSITLDNHIHLDGNQIMQNTTEHMYNGLNVPPASGSNFDGRMSYLPSAP